MVSREAKLPFFSNLRNESMRGPIMAGMDEGNI
jgi:hypothetical protein